MTHSTKFDSEFTETVWLQSMDGQCEEEFGTVDERGWFGLIEAESGEWAILHEDSQGFVYSESFDNRAAAGVRFDEIRSDLYPYEDVE